MMNVVHVSSVSGNDDRLIAQVAPSVDIDVVVIAFDHHLVVVAIMAMGLGHRRGRTTNVDVLVIPFDYYRVVVTTVWGRRAAMDLDMVVVTLHNDGVMIMMVVVVVGCRFRRPMEVDGVVVSLDHNFIVVITVVVGRR